MGQALDQVGATVPLLAALGVRGKGLRGEVQLAPGDHRQPHVEREVQLVDLDLVVDRRQRLQEVVQGVGVLAGDAGEEGVGEGRVQVFAVLADAVVHGAIKIVCTPVADAGGRVRGDVWGQQLAERGVDGHAAGVVLAAVCGVAGAAVTGTGQIGADGGVWRRGGCAGGLAEQ